MSRKHLAFALLLPLCAITLGIVRAELHLAHGRDFVFEVEGYDPRDLLRGQYLQFRLKVPEAVPRAACSPATQDCCLCLTSTGAGAPPLAEPATCELAQSQCDGALRTEHVSRQYRYFIPEARAQSLEKRLLDAIRDRQAYVTLAIDKGGNPAIRELRLYGKAIERKAK